MDLLEMFARAILKQDSWITDVDAQGNHLVPEECVHCGAAVGWTWKYPAEPTCVHDADCVVRKARASLDNITPPAPPNSREEG